MHQLFHPGTLLTMSHTIWSSAVLIVLEGCVRVLVSAPQHMPFDVRTMMLVVPGKLPPCHQLPLPLSRTIQPRAYLAAPGGYAAAGVVMVTIVSGLSRLGTPGAPATCVQNFAMSDAFAIHPPCESIRVTFIL